jgi:hypothetical protein
MPFLVRSGVAWCRWCPAVLTSSARWRGPAGQLGCRRGLGEAWGVGRLYVARPLLELSTAVQAGSAPFGHGGLRQTR